jgi:hypothetical protein
MSNEEKLKGQTGSGAAAQHQKTAEELARLKEELQKQAEKQQNTGSAAAAQALAKLANGLGDPDLKKNLQVLTKDPGNAAASAAVTKKLGELANQSAAGQAGFERDPSKALQEAIARLESGQASLERLAAKEQGNGARGSNGQDQGNRQNPGTQSGRENRQGQGNLPGQGNKPGQGNQPGNQQQGQGNQPGQGEQGSAGEGTSGRKNTLKEDPNGSVIGPEGMEGRGSEGNGSTGSREEKREERNQTASGNITATGPEGAEGRGPEGNGPTGSREGNSEERNPTGSGGGDGNGPRNGGNGQAVSDILEQMKNDVQQAAALTNNPTIQQQADGVRKRLDRHYAESANANLVEALTQISGPVKELIALLKKSVGEVTRQEMLRQADLDEAPLMYRDAVSSYLESLSLDYLKPEEGTAEPPAGSR